ncbi:MAG TPA: hypothetical protein VIC05_13205 [Solirubrobacteraceae bacterium]
MATVEEPAAEGALIPGDAFGGSAGVALCCVGTLLVGAEAPQPAISTAARSSATAVVRAAQFERRDPDIRGLWGNNSR